VVLPIVVEPQVLPLIFALLRSALAACPDTHVALDMIDGIV
jgi:hypothetical protein